MKYVRLPAEHRGWIGFGLDGTLALSSTRQAPDALATIGEPIPAMVERFLRHLNENDHELRIVTSRVALDLSLSESAAQYKRDKAREGIEAWCKLHLGVTVPVTECIGPDMVQLYDARAIGVVFNTGHLVSDYRAELPPVPGYGPENVG